MQTLIIAILTHTLIGFIFKLYPKYGVNTLQAIVVNYFVCVTMAGLTLGEFPIESNVYQTNWFPYALLLGCVFISGFNLTAYVFQKFGVTLTIIMQKMSLILTVPLAIWLYHEGFNGWKMAGMIAALLAIWFTNQPSKADQEKVATLPRWMLVLPILVLLVNFIIEGGLQFVEEEILGTSGDPKFVATLFGIAGTIGLFVVLGGYATGRLFFSWKNIVGGIVLGIPNFYSIYLILIAIGEGWDGSVFFPVLSVAVIALSALGAYLFFKEKLSTTNLVGVALAMLAIGLIAIGS